MDHAPRFSEITSLYLLTGLLLVAVCGYLPDTIIILGDSFLPKLKEKNFGATVRIVLTPEQTSQSLISMPVGQCSNPLSNKWPEGHPSWVADRPASLLLGDNKYTLFIKPLSHARASAVATCPEQQESDS